MIPPPLQKKPHKIILKILKYCSAEKNQLEGNKTKITLKIAFYNQI